jgi:amino acid permease
LSVPISARGPLYRLCVQQSGLLPLLFWLVLVGSLTTVTMLYVAESTLRTRKHLQLSGLSQRYVGALAR